MIQESLKRLGIRPVFSAYLNLSAKDIDNLERSLDATVPDALKSILMNCGVSTFDGIVTIRAETGQEYGFWIFYGGTGPRATYDIFRNRNVLIDQLPPGLLAFAMDPFGNQYCVRYSGDGYGQILYWDSESRTTTIVATSLDELVGRLHIEPVE